MTYIYLLKIYAHRRVRNAHHPLIDNAHFTLSQPVRTAHPTNSTGAHCAPYKFNFCGVGFEQRPKYTI